MRYSHFPLVLIICDVIQGIYRTILVLKGTCFNLVFVGSKTEKKVVVVM